MPTELDIEFAKITIIDNKLAEIIVEESIELTLNMVNIIHKTLRDNLTAPFNLLVNKINKYSYEFDAMYELGTIEELKAIAVICYSDKAEKNTQYIADFNRTKQWNMKIFSDREASLEWINQQK